MPIALRHVATDVLRESLVCDNMCNLLHLTLQVKHPVSCIWMDSRSDTVELLRLKCTKLRLYRTLLPSVPMSFTCPLLALALLSSATPS